MYYSLTNGEKVRLELTNARLLKLRNDNPDVYQKYYTAYKKFGDIEKLDLVFDVLDVIYAGYLCGMMVDPYAAEVMAYEEFVELTPFDIEYNSSVAAQLISAKKPKASAKPSKKPLGNEKTEA